MSHFPDIDDAWNEALGTLARAGIDLRSKPVFLVLGRSATSTAGLFQAARLELDGKQTPPQSAAPLRLYAAKDAAYIAVDGEGGTARFEHFCRILAHARRPYVPINGVLLLIPFAALNSDQEALETGARYQRDLEVIRRVLQVQSPTLVLVCDLETAPGFRAFLERFPEKQRHQRIGHRCPLVPDFGGDPATARTAMFDSLAQWVCGSVVAGWVSKHYRLETPGRDSVSEVTTDNSHLFLFMNELRQRGRRLGRLLARGLTLETPEPVWFGGCYLAATGTNPASEQGFVAGVFKRLSEEEKKGLVSWTPSALNEEARLQRWVGVLRIVLALIVVAALAMIGIVVWGRFPTGHD